MKNTLNLCTWSGARVGISGTQRTTKKANCANCGKTLAIRCSSSAEFATLPNHSKTPAGAPKKEEQGENIPVRLVPSTIARLDAKRAPLGLSRSAAIRAALDQYLLS